MEAYMIGSSEKLEISADIKNSGEDAFNAMLYLQIPRGVNYISANSRYLPTTQISTSLTSVVYFDQWRLCADGVCCLKYIFFAFYICFTPFNIKMIPKQLKNTQ